ncbi:MAG: hypothetical protein H8E15_03005 [Planctomycetes bacterium]|nr:hypothetical protein [Planctomycetota bacterium]
MAFRAAEYSRFDGPRSKKPAWFPIFHATIRRGWQSKWVRMLTRIGAITALACTGLIYLLYQVIPNWFEYTESMGRMVKGDEDFFRITPDKYLGLLYVFVYPMLMPLALVFGYDLLSADIRSNAFESYFSRSITPSSYLFGRTLAYICFLLLATLAPMLWIWFFDVNTAPDEHFDVVKSVPWNFIKSMTVISLTLALMVQAVTTLTRSGIWTNLTFVGIFLFSGPLGTILAEITDNHELYAIGFMHCVKVFCADCMNSMDTLKWHHASAGTVKLVFLSLNLISLTILLKGLKRRSLLG